MRYNNVEDIVNHLIEKKKTISTMESCTGGGVANAITNIEGASEILKFSAVTYSNEYKIKMGVNRKTIDSFSVYSIEVAQEMAYNISKFANSNYGVGITGKLNRADINNNFGEDNEVFISIYDKDNNTYTNDSIKVYERNRELNKKIVIDRIISKIQELIINKSIKKTNQ